MFENLNFILNQCDVSQIFKIKNPLKGQIISVQIVNLVGKITKIFKVFDE